jgi:hypothetical protein
VVGAGEEETGGHPLVALVAQLIFISPSLHSVKALLQELDQVNQSHQPLRVTARVEVVRIDVPQPGEFLVAEVDRTGVVVQLGLPEMVGIDYRWGANGVGRQNSLLEHRHLQLGSQSDQVGTSFLSFWLVSFLIGHLRLVGCV